MNTANPFDTSPDSGTSVWFSPVQMQMFAVITPEEAFANVNIRFCSYYLKLYFSSSFSMVTTVWLLRHHPAAQPIRLLQRQNSLISLSRLDLTLKAYIDFFQALTLSMFETLWSEKTIVCQQETFHSFNKMEFFRTGHKISNQELSAPPPNIYSQNPFRGNNSDLRLQCRYVLKASSLTTYFPEAKSMTWLTKNENLFVCTPDHILWYICPEPQEIFSSINAWWELESYMQDKVYTVSQDYTC